MRLEPLTEPLRSKRNRRVYPFRRSVVIHALATMVLLAPIPAAAAAPAPSKPTEYDVKAAYLLNFGKFVRRSTSISTGSSFEICTLGHDPIASSLDALADDSRINGLPVHTTHLQDISAAK